MGMRGWYFDITGVGWQYKYMLGKVEEVR